MDLKFTYTSAAMAVVLSLMSAAFAGAKDYSFEPVKADIKKGNEIGRAHV